MSDPSPPTPLPRAGEGSKDPIRAAQANMSQRVVRRFYKSVSVREAADGRHELILDGRPARTPGREPLAASSREVVARVGEEWERQGETLDPADMPLTRLLNSAIDGVAGAMEETRAEILRYAGSDLLCYRAETPEGLAERQAAAFDPVLRWATEALGARFVPTSGLIHLQQRPEALAAFGNALETFDDPAALAALSAITTLTGSAILALAVARRFLTSAEAWRAAHVDEDWQTERWGVDTEVQKRRQARWREMEAAAIMLPAVGDRSGKA